MILLEKRHSGRQPEAYAIADFATTLGLSFGFFNFLFFFSF